MEWAAGRSGPSDCNGFFYISDMGLFSFLLIPLVWEIPCYGKILTKIIKSRYSGFLWDVLTVGAGKTELNNVQ